MTDESQTSCPTCGTPIVVGESCQTCVGDSPNGSDEVSAEASSSPQAERRNTPILDSAGKHHSDGDTTSLETSEVGPDSDEAVLAEVVVDEGPKTDADPINKEADDSVVGAELIDGEAVEGDPGEDASSQIANHEEAQEAELVEDDGNTPRLRSPFAPDYRLGLDDRKRKQDRKRREYYAAKGGSVGALTLGIMAIPGAFITPASAVTALLGIGMGIWGLLSQHRRMALIGLLLCFVAIALIFLRGVLGISDLF